MRIRCGNCGELYDLYSAMGGQLFTCQNCGAVLQLPPSDCRDVNDLKLCPHCRKLVDSDAAVCPYCDELLVDMEGSAMPESGKQRKIYILLGLFFGAYGIHNFYAGRRSVGCIQFFMGLTIVLLPLTVLWSYCEICSVTEDGTGRKMK